MCVCVYVCMYCICLFIHEFIYLLVIICADICQLELYSYSVKKNMFWMI